MRRIALFVFVLVVVVALIGGYEFIVNLSYTRHITLPANMLASSTDVNHTADTAASSTVSSGVFGLDDQTLSAPASSTADTSLWVAYTNAVAGYTINYPKNFSVNTDATGNIALSFPKDQYFHWPLLDDARVTIAISSTCPALQGGPVDPSPAELSINDYPFTRIEGSDVAAGNVYHELAYDTVAHGVCYHIDLLDHGANGAGLYVSDQSLIASYNGTHDTDLKAVVEVFNAMVNTFRLTQNM